MQSAQLQPLFRLRAVGLSLVVSLASLMFTAGCGSGDPFSYVQVRGTVAYDDGTRIPATELMLTFFPQSPPLNKDTYPCPGASVVNIDTGEFHDVTSHHYNDGLVPGEHKVTLTKIDHSPLPQNLVPIEYSDVSKTPWVIDTSKQPFELKVRRPRR